MKKNEIKEKIEEKINLIKTNSKDAKFADKLIDDLMSLKGQYDVEEVEFIVPAKDVIKEYDFDSYKFVKTTKGVLFHAKGGYTVFVSLRMRSLYERIISILDLKDNYETLSDDDKGIYDAMFSATYYVMSSAFLLSPFEDKFFEVATRILEAINDAYKDYIKDTELSEETPSTDAEFEDKLDLANTVLLGEKNDRTVG